MRSRSAPPALMGAQEIDEPAPGPVPDILPGPVEQVPPGAGAQQEAGGVGGVPAPRPVRLYGGGADRLVPGPGQHVAHGRRVRQREHAGLTRGAQWADGQQVTQRLDGQKPLGAAGLRRADEGDTAAGAQRPPDVGEGGDGIGEEHHREPADRHVEAPGPERMDLDIRLLERHIAERFVLRGLPRAGEHRRRQVEPQRLPAARPPRGEPGGGPRPAADVEDTVPVGDCRGGEQGFVESLVHTVPTGLVGGPVRPLVTVPCLLLIRADGVSHTVLPGG